MILLASVVCLILGAAGVLFAVALGDYNTGNHPWWVPFLGLAGILMVLAGIGGSVYAAAQFVASLL